MRRESSLAARETSREPKASSKLKRRKNGHLVNVDRKIENIPMNILEEQQAKYRSSHRFKEPLQEKMRMIGKCLEKVLNKKQMEQYAKLSRWIQKQFSIRCCLQDNEMQGNMPKIKQLKGFLARILEKEEDLAKQWVFLLCQYTMSNGSGLFMSDVIARQMSPKHKFIGFGTLEKKKSEYQFNLPCLQEQIAKKDQIIRGLFQKIDKLGFHASIQQKQKSITFGRCIEMISSKLQKNQQEYSKNYQLELSIQRQGKEINALSQQSNVLKNQNAKLYNDLNVAEEERERLEKKYKDLNEEFQELVGEKIQIEIQQSKRSKEFESAIYKYRQLLGKSKLKLQEIIKQEMQQIKNMHQYQKHCIQQELSLMWSLMKDEVQVIVKQVRCDFEQDYQRLSEKCFNMQRKYKQLQREFESITKVNQEYKRHNDFRQQEHRKKLRCYNRVSQLNWCQKKKNSFTIRAIEIYHTPTEKIELALSEYMVQTDQQIKKTPQLSFSDIQIAILQPKIKKDHQTQTIPSQKHQSAQTQLNSTANAITQSLYPQLHLQSALIDLRYKLSNQNNDANLAVYQTLDYWCCPQRQIIEECIQTQDYFEIPTVPNFTIGQENEHGQDEDMDMNSGQIIKMLQEAEDCLQIGQVQIVREEMIRCKEEIDKLRAKIAQLQKEKQQENVFNFRL